MNKDFICIGSIAKHYDEMKRLHDNAAKYNPEYKIRIPVKIGDDIYAEQERFNMTRNWIKMGEGYSSVLVFNDEECTLTPEGLGFHTFAELLIFFGQGKNIYFTNELDLSSAPNTLWEEVPDNLGIQGIYKLVDNIFGK